MEARRSSDKMCRIGTAFASKEQRPRTAGEREMEANADKRTRELQQALTCAENIVATLRETFVVPDKGLRIRTANAVCYRDFRVSNDETQGRFVCDLGNGQWDIPRLRTPLSQVVSDSDPVKGFEVVHALLALGRSAATKEGG
jgi:hypothetical protein